MERRIFELTDVRAEGEGGERVILGYAAVFNQLSLPMWGMREQIRPGAFTKTIQEADVRALWNHNVDYVLGRTKSRTLSLREDEHGLWVEIKPPSAAWAEGFMESIQRGDVDQMSFSFDTVRDIWETVEGEQIRTLVEVKLYEVSPVTFPAYTQTEVSLRSMADAVAKLRNPDPAELRRVINGLTALLPNTPAPAEDGHPDEDAWQRGIQARRRALELIA